MKVAILIHGFNVANPELTVGKLRPYLEYQGYKVVMFRYGCIGLLGVWRRNKKLAKKLANLVDWYRVPGSTVHVFSHSNGSTITRLAANYYQADIDAAICINPALTRDLNPAPNADFVHVYYNDEDRAVKLGKWLRWLNPFARASRPWGEMGRHGYNGKDSNVENFDTEAGEYPYKAVGHSGVFKEPAMSSLGPIIAQRAASYRQTKII